MTGGAPWDARRERGESGACSGRDGRDDHDLGRCRDDDDRVLDAHGRHQRDSHLGSNTAETLERHIQTKTEREQKDRKKKRRKEQIRT